MVTTGSNSPLHEGVGGILEPLDKYLATWEHADRFPEQVWEAVRVNGVTYAIPQDIAVRAIAYNKLLFSDVGLDPDVPPQSWDDLISYSRALTRTDESGQVLVRGLQIQSEATGAAQDLFWVMRQAGVPEVDAETMSPNFSRPEALDALETMVEIAEVNQLFAPILPGGFSGGRIAMERQWPHSQRRLFQENPAFREIYGLFAPRMTPESTPVAHAYINGIGIMKTSENKDLAWEFIKTLYEEETLYQIETLSGFFSGHLDLVNRHLTTNPELRLFLDVFPYIQTSLIIPPPIRLAHTELGQGIIQAYQRIIPPLSALEHAQRVWTSLFEAWK